MFNNGDRKFVGKHQMKKKLLYGALFLTLILWILTGLNPFQLLVSFVAAGALPGLHISISPYIMFGLACVGGILLFMKASAIEVRLSPFEENSGEKENIAALKISPNTHRRSTKHRRRFTQIEA